MFLVNYWVPFPRSEYGGLQCVIARSKEEAKEVIKEAAGDFVIDSFSDAEERIEARVNKSDVYELVGTEIKEPCLVRSFET
jgi:NADPH:quinone reductase-like Zn-dependent oxidoreductase